MAYVPPHRRAQGGSSSSIRPTTVETPPLNRRVRNNFRKWFAVDGNSETSNLLLEFRPFTGKPPEHLRDKKLYTLFANPPVNERLEVENNMQTLAINETSLWKKICERFKDQIPPKFHDAAQIYIEKSRPDNMKLIFVIRFGKLLFRGCGLNCNERFTIDTFEEALKAETSFQKSVMKTMNTHIQKNILEALKEKILAGLQTPEVEEKENYFIEIKDNLVPDVIMRLRCVKNYEDGGQLRLKKIQIVPSEAYIIANTAYFIADISCVNKSMDLRLALYIEEYLTERTLQEEVREYIGVIVKSACIENGAQGGLHWPHGRNSVGNRFKVVSLWHRKVTTIVGKLWTIKLLHVNRANFENSFGGVTHEVNLKLTSLTKYLRDRVQWSEENIMNTLEDILEWVWTECL